jgi:hypothetical protein
MALGTSAGGVLTSMYGVRVVAAVAAGIVGSCALLLTAMFIPYTTKRAYVRAAPPALARCR